ncbi:MAG: hypothetical protein ABL904_26780, partial [Hyphomicrobiaceae bacterium]
FDPLTMDEAIHTAIHAYLAVLILRLQQAEKLAVEAAAALSTGRRNLAIGTVLPLEKMLPECEALFRAALILHRMEPQGRDGGAA